MAIKPRHRLSQKQIRFIREYAIHGNASEAVRTAGYKLGTAVRQQASENLSKPVIRAAIELEVAKIAPEMTPMRVQRRLDAVGRAAEAAGQFGPAVRAEELIGKSIGMWVDQSIQLTGALNDSHVSALLEIARKRRAQPVDLQDETSD